jgi:hypothetical protein
MAEAGKIGGPRHFKSHRTTKTPSTIRGHDIPLRCGRIQNQLAMTKTPNAV